MTREAGLPDSQRVSLIEQSAIEPRALRLGTFNAENLYLLLDKPYLRAELEALPEDCYQAMNPSIYNRNKDRRKLSDIAELILREDFDVLGLCEIGGMESLANFNRLYLNGRYDCFLHEENSRRGIFVGALVKPGVFTRVRAKAERGLFSRNLLRLELSLPGGTMRVFVVHLKSPLGQDLGIERRIEEVRQLARLVSGHACVVMGDFNGILIRGQHQFEFEPFLELPLKDVLDSLGIDPDKRYTHYHFGPAPNFAQLDYLFASPDMRVVDGGVIEGLVPMNRRERDRLMSDHLMLKATILPDFPKKEPTDSGREPLYRSMTETDEGGFGPGSPKRRVWDHMESRLAVYLGSFSGLGPEDSEEILQSAMVALWRAGPEELEDARPWLYRVTRNAAIDAARNRKRRGEPGRVPLAERERALETARSALPGPEDLALSAEDRNFVRDFLALLSAGERELAHLAFAEDLPYSRIAGITGLPLGTVKWKLASVKRKLATSYQRRMA